MANISRRKFIKTAAIVGTATTLSGNPTGNILAQSDSDTAEVFLNGEGGVFTVVSDVDAHSQCQMRVVVKNGKVEEIQGNPTDPEGKGELTLRGQHMKEILYAKDRLKYPLKRVGERGEGRWTRITWEEALATIASRFKELKNDHGAESISFHHGHYHSGDILGTYIPRLANLIGTPNVCNPSHICHLPRVFLEYRIDLGAVLPPDVPHTKCLIIWGGNPKATNKPQEIAIREARERGMKLIVVDPRQTEYAKNADIWAALRPGTDGALALGMLHVLIKEDLYDHDFVKEWTIGFAELAKHIEQYTPEKMEKITWVPANTIKSMARIYANNKPSSISPRTALDQNTNVTCAIRAINALMAVSGYIDVKGGNVMDLPISMGINDLKLYEKLPEEAAKKKIGSDTCLYSKLNDIWPSAHTPSMWNAIIHHDPYPVKAMMIIAANPVLASANTNVVVEALKKLDFLIVTDIFMTKTAELADIVLPASTFLETTRFVTYDTHADHWWNKTSRIAISPRVIDPLWESWPDWKILCQLGRKMGFAKYFPWQNEEEAINEVISPLGITCDELMKHPNGITMEVPTFLYKEKGLFARIKRSLLKVFIFGDYPDMYQKYKMKGFFTKSGKIELYSKRLQDYGHDPLPVYVEPAESPYSKPDLAREFPLILIAGSKLPSFTHSMMRNIKSLRRFHPENLLEINPQTADKLAIANNDRVKISSLRGSIEVKAEITNRIDPRVVHLFHGFNDSNCNVLTDHAAFDPVTGSTGLKSLLCKVEKMEF